MTTTATPRNRHFARGLTSRDVLCLAAALGVLLLLLPAGLSSGQSSRKKTVCASNLRGIAQGQHIYANDNQESFPTHTFTNPGAFDEKVPNGHSVQWIGTMGSHDFLSITEDTGKKSPDRNHPSRAQFLLIIQGISTPAQFICPDSGDKVDNLRNSAGGGESDADDDDEEADDESDESDDADKGDADKDDADSKDPAAQPGINRFDFKGYKHLSYAYQLPYARKARPREGLDSRMAITADKGPYFKADKEAVKGSNTSPDMPTDIVPPTWTDKTLEELVALKDEWQPYNTRSHKKKGQNVLFVDGHAEWFTHPIMGVERDNLYTIQGSITDPLSVALGVMPAADQLIGPLTHTDSFLVP